jgi:hypothetical protein
VLDSVVFVGVCDLKVISSLWRFVLCSAICDGGGQFSVVKSKSGMS